MWFKKKNKTPKHVISALTTKSETSLSMGCLILSELETKKHVLHPRRSLFTRQLNYRSNPKKTFKSIGYLLIMSPQGINKMGFIDSVSAAFTHHDTIAGGMHLQKRFGETKRRRA